jgi:hypothetical protein
MPLCPQEVSCDISSQANNWVSRRLLAVPSDCWTNWLRLLYVSVFYRTAACTIYLHCDHAATGFVTSLMAILMVICVSLFHSNSVIHHINLFFRFLTVPNNSAWGVSTFFQRMRFSPVLRNLVARLDDMPGKAWIQSFLFINEVLTTCATSVFSNFMLASWGNFLCVFCLLWYPLVGRTAVRSCDMINTKTVEYYLEFLGRVPWR